MLHDALVNITTAVVKCLVAWATFAAETANNVDAGLNGGTIVAAAVAFIIVNAVVVRTCSIVVAVFGGGELIDVVAFASIADIPVIAFGGFLWHIR